VKIAGQASSLIGARNKLAALFAASLRRRREDVEALIGATREAKIITDRDPVYKRWRGAGDC
jgi:hypothetical protein